MRREKSLAVVVAAGWVLAAAGGCNGRRDYMMRGDPRVARSRAVSALHKTAADADKFTRAKAIEAMVSVWGPAAGQAYISALSDPEPNVRFAAAVAVGDLKYAPARARLLIMVQYKQPRAERRYTVYCGVIYALHQLGRTEYTGQLGELLSHDGAVVRASAAMVLGRMAGGRMDDGSAIRMLRPLYDDEQDVSVKLQVLESMARLGDKWSLAKLENHALEPFLEKKLLALRAMGELKSDRAALVLRGIVNSLGEPPQARVLAAGSLARIGTVTDFGYELCLTAAGDPAGLFRAAMRHAYDPKAVDRTMLMTLQRLAVISLGWMRRPHAVDVLVDVLATSKDGGVRVGAAMSILRLLPQSTDPAAAARGGP